MVKAAGLLVPSPATVQSLTASWDAASLNLFESSERALLHLKASQRRINGYSQKDLESVYSISFPSKHLIIFFSLNTVTYKKLFIIQFQAFNVPTIIVTFPLPVIPALSSESDAPQHQAYLFP